MQAHALGGYAEVPLLKYNYCESLSFSFVDLVRLLLMTALGVASVQAFSGPVSLKDMNGYDLLLNAPAQRTVTAPMPASSIYATVNKGVNGLVGMHPSTHNNLKTMLLPTIFPSITQVRHDITRGSSFSPNVESLLELNPDLLWQWGHMGEDLLTPIRAAGLKVAALRYSTEEQTQEWISLFSLSVGDPARGKKINNWRNHVRTQLQLQLATTPESQRQKVMYLSRYKTGMAAAGQSGNFNSDLNIAGGRNVNDSKADSPTINVEQILIWDPDVIVLTNFEHDLTPETLYKNPMLSQLSAVRNKRVYKVPAGGYYWDPPSQDSPLYWIWLAKLMYPQTVQFDMRHEIRSAYQMLYGFDISDSQIDQVLHVDTNQLSLNYLSTFAARKQTVAS